MDKAITKAFHPRDLRIIVQALEVYRACLRNFSAAPPGGMASLNVIADIPEIQKYLRGDS